MPGRPARDRRCRAPSARRARDGRSAAAGPAPRAAPVRSGATPDTPRGPPPSDRYCRCRPRRRGRRGWLLQRLQRRLEHLLRAVQPFLPERLGQRGAAGIGLALALLLMHEAADARTRLAGDDEPLPLRGRRAAARGHDLDLVAVLQLVAQRHQPAVHLRADAGVADLAVHGIGEIDRRGAARKLDELALRREAEDLVLVQFELGVIEEVVRRRRRSSRMSSRSWSQRKCWTSLAVTPTPSCL